MNLQTVSLLVGIVSGVTGAVATICKVGFSRVLGGFVFLCLLSGGVWLVVAFGGWDALPSKTPDPERTTPGKGNGTIPTPVTKELILANTARQTGEYTDLGDGRVVPVYEWTVYLVGTSGQLQEVEGVTYELPAQWFRDPVRAGSPNAAAGFPMTNSGWGEFDLKATVHFKDPSRRPLELFHRLRLSA
jgi:hypothetical protein